MSTERVCERCRAPHKVYSDGSDLGFCFGCREAITKEIRHLDRAYAIEKVKTINKLAELVKEALGDLTERDLEVLAYRIGDGVFGENWKEYTTRCGDGCCSYDNHKFELTFDFGQEGTTRFKQTLKKWRQYRANGEI